MSEGKKGKRFQFLFMTGLDVQLDWTDPDEMYQHFDREMIMDHMITGLRSKYLWGPNKKSILEVHDEHKGDRHLVDVTDANTYWVWRLGTTVYILHGHHLKKKNINPGTMKILTDAAKCHTSEQAVEAVWQCMFEKENS